MSLVAGSIITDTAWAGLGTPAAGAGTTVNGAGWSVGTYTAEFTQGGCYHIRVAVGYSGSTLTPNATGMLSSGSAMCNLPNPPVVTSWVPSVHVRSGSNYTFGIVQINPSSGACLLLGVAPGATVASGDNVSFSFTYAAQGP